MRLRPRRGLLLVGLAGALATPGSATGDDAACRVDAATGLPVPVVSPGLCLLGADASDGFVQRGSDGWLIVTPSGSARTGAGIASDGERLLQALDDDMHIVYCPAAKLGAACFDASTRSAGPAASAGRGRLQGNVVLGAAGVGCPGFLRVTGEVRGAAGPARALTASLTLVPDPMRPGGCLAHDAVAVANGSAGARARGGAEALPLDDERLRVLAQLMTLDAAQLGLLETLLRVAPADWPALQGYLGRDGAASLSASGRVSPAGDGQAAAGDVTVTASAITDLLDTVLSRLSSVSSRINTLLARLPDRPDLRTLADEITPARVKEVIDVVADEFQGLMDLVNEERAEFHSFVGPDRSCASGTPCAAFRATLVRVLDDLGELWTDGQKLRCIRKPDLRVLPLRDGLFRRLVIEKAPPIVLYAMSRALEAVDGWDTRIREVADGIPADLTELCDGSARPLSGPDSARIVPAASACSGSANRVCCALRPEGRQKAVNAVTVVLALAKLGFAIAEEWTDDKKVFTIGATAVAGATAGKGVKVPGKPLFATVKEVFDSTGDALKDLLDKRKECLDDEAAWELDLIRGNARVEYLLPASAGGTWEELHEMVGRRIDEMATQLTEDDTRIVNARSHWNEAAKDANKAKREGFNSLRKAHREITSRAKGGDDETP